MPRKNKQRQTIRAESAPDLGGGQPQPSQPTSQAQAELDAEITLQRQVNAAMFALLNNLKTAANADDTTLQATQVKVAQALTSGTKSVARLMRDRRALAGHAVDSLNQAIARSLDELSNELGAKL